MVTPEEAKAKIEEQIAAAGISEPKNLEEQALSAWWAGIFMKRWSRDIRKSSGAAGRQSCRHSSSSRLPVRFTYDNNYFNDRCIRESPMDGYTEMVERMLEGIEVRLGVRLFRGPGCAVRPGQDHGVYRHD